VVPQVPARLREHARGDRELERWVAIREAPVAFEGVPALKYLAVQVAGLPRCPDVPLELAVVRLQLVVGDGPVLDGASCGQPLLAVALHMVGPVVEVGREEAPELRRP